MISLKEQAKYDTVKNQSLILPTYFTRLNIEDIIVVRRLISLPWLLSTSISEVNGVPPTAHCATRAAKFPTFKHGKMTYKNVQNGDNISKILGRLTVTSLKKTNMMQ